MTVEYGNRLIRIERPRAQGRSPPPGAGTGTMTFNVPATFSPNPSITGSVIGNKHPSHHSFLQPCPPNRPEHARVQRGGRNVPSRPPRDIQSQRLAQQGFARHLTLEQACSFQGKGWATKDGTSTTLTRLQSRCTSVQRISWTRTAHRSRILGHE